MIFSRSLIKISYNSQAFENYGADLGFRQISCRTDSMSSATCKTATKITVNNTDYAPAYAKAA